MDRESLERLVVRLVGIAQRCGDLPVRHDLLRAADELTHIIEGRMPQADLDKPPH